MTSTDSVTFNECDDTKCLEANVCMDGEGYLLRVPVYLYNVCPCRKLVVGVSVYVGNQYYTMKTRKVFTGGCRFCPVISKFYAGEFIFLFTDDCCENIRTCVFSHYVCR